MALYGYARVSSADQDYTLQEQALRQAGCDVIRAEKASGTTRNGRTELDLLLEFLRPGDTLVVTRRIKFGDEEAAIQYEGVTKALERRNETTKAYDEFRKTHPFVAALYDSAFRKFK
jgi:DNA invertase Pin-like site-specific DNA recombinase